MMQPTEAALQVERTYVYDARPDILMDRVASLIPACDPEKCGICTPSCGVKTQYLQFTARFVKPGYHVPCMTLVFDVHINKE